VRKILIALSLSLLIPTAVCWSVCCTSITAGPTAWAPEYSKVGCAAASKASYGGTANVQADATNLYMSTIVVTSKVMSTAAGRSPVAAGSQVLGRDVRCNAETVVASWTTTPSCVIPRGTMCFTRWSVATTACATAPAQTVTVDSAVTTSP
jgi:hypothetical protein